MQPKDVKRYLNERVTDGEQTGYFTACTLRIREGQFRYEAEIQGFGKHGNCSVPLETVYPVKRRQI